MKTISFIIPIYYQFITLCEYNIDCELPQICCTFYDKVKWCCNPPKKKLAPITILKNELY